MSLRLLPLLATLSLTLLLAACETGGGTRPTPAAVVPAPQAVAVKPIRVGLALGGGAAKCFAHIGVIKMLEANGIDYIIVHTGFDERHEVLGASPLDDLDAVVKAVSIPVVTSPCRPFVIATREVRGQGRFPMLIKAGGAPCRTTRIDASS